jgi:hypothetical protein
MKIQIRLVAVIAAILFLGSPSQAKARNSEPQTTATVPIATQMGMGGAVSNPRRMQSLLRQVADNPDVSLDTAPVQWSTETDVTYVVFDAPGAAGATFPAAINTEGTVTGNYFDANTALHGFVRTRDGSITTLDIANAGTGSLQGTYPAALNDFGAITGAYYDAALSGHGFLLVKKIFGNGYSVITFDVPGAGTGGLGGTSPLAINNFGAITGGYYDANFVSHGFVRDPFGKLTSFDPPGSTATYPTGINDWGTIAGWYTDANDVHHGFLRSWGGTLSTFDGPGSTHVGVVNGINLQGDTIGTYFHTVAGNFFGGIYSGFVRGSDGVFSTFDATTSQYLYETDPLGVNLEGDTTGLSITPTLAFVRKRSGVLTIFDASGGIGVTTPVAINSPGTITGFFYVGDVAHGFLRLQKE